MTLGSSLASHRSLLQATKLAVRSLRGQFRRDPETLIVGITDKIGTRKEIQDSLSYISSEFGTPNIIGQIDPIIFINDALPTTQGIALFGWTKDEPLTSKLVLPSINARAFPKKVGAFIGQEYQHFSNPYSDHALLLFAGGSVLSSSWVKDMKVFDSFFARHFPSLFQVIARKIEKKMAKNGLSVVNYMETVLDTIASYSSKNVIGGASFSRFADVAYEFANTTVRQNSCLGLMVASDHYHFSTSWGFAGRKIGTLSASSVVASYVRQFNNKNAKKEYLTTLSLHEHDIIEHFQSQLYANTYHLLAVNNGNGSYSPFVSLSPPSLDGVLIAIPPNKFHKGTTFDVLVQSGEDILATASQTVSQSISLFSQPKGGIIFECCNRVYNLGDKIQEENARIQEVLGRDVPYIGFGTGGEFSIKPHIHVVNSSIHSLFFGV